MNVLGLATNMNIFLSGAVSACCWVVALFFLRFYIKSRDRLFICFACSFFMLGVERIVITMSELSRENVGPVVVIRVVAFTLILLAIIDRNRRSV